MGVPTQPGVPVFTHELPTTLTVSWAASSGDGGKPITAYLLRRYTGSSPTGPFVDSVSNNRARNLTNLASGTIYTFRVYAQNADGYSDSSDTATIQMPGACWVRYENVWKIAIPYVRSGGVWKMAIPSVRSTAIWKNTN